MTAEDRDGRKTFSLTEAGQAAAKAVPADRPWSRHEGRNDLGGLIRELNVAAIQVNRVGSPAARDEAGKVLTDARRALYRLLADDDATAADPEPRPDPQTGVARTSVRASARPPVHGWP